ncbi:MAG: hypothetical protein ABFS34_09515 [Gemmatimonadota bacterium]
MEELIPIFLFLMIGAVAILRPVTKKIGLLIEAMAEERKAALRGPSDLSAVQFERVTHLLERMSDRFDHMEERVQFVERLIDNREHKGRLSV